MTATTLTGNRSEELMSRCSNGVHVSLLWSRNTDRLSVTVVDASADFSFEIEVADASPLDVFNHPYAYAAFRGIDTGAVLGERLEHVVAV